MANVLSDIAKLLDDAGVATPAVDLFAGIRPGAAPDDCLVIFEYQGPAAEETFGAGDSPSVARPNIQVAGRGKTYVAARDLTWAAYEALRVVVNAEVNGTMYQRIAPTSQPFGIGQDAKNLYLVVCNFAVWKDDE